MPTTSTMAKIADMLFQAVEGAFAATYDIVYPGSSFTPGTTPYLEVSLLPNGLAWEGMDDERTYQGSLQIAVHQPNQFGLIETIDAAGAIADTFPQHITANGVTIRIIKAPAVAAITSTGTHFRVPVTIHYHAYED